MARLERLSDAAFKISELNAKVAAKIALDIDRRLVNRTPRDTGRAARNWIVSVDKKDDRKLPEPGTPGEANQAIAEAEAVLKNAKPKRAIYIQNNLEYIQALNNGHSPQAPPGYVDAEIKAVLSMYR